MRAFCLEGECVMLEADKSVSMQIILFLGPPGAGKGTISQLCTERLGWKSISTGDLCRQHVFEQTEIGKQIDSAMKSGALVSDELVAEMVVEGLERLCSEFSPTVILDGYPRTVNQAAVLQKHLEHSFSSKVCVIRLLVSDACVVDRLSRRYICQNNKCKMIYSFDSENESIFSIDNLLRCTICAEPLNRRYDDEHAIIVNRLAVYRQSEQDLIQFYEQSNALLHAIDVEKPVHEVFQHFLSLVDNKES